MNIQVLSQEEIIDRIANRDVIYVVGGHTDYLMSVFVKTKFVQLLLNLLKDKVYVGSSAGSVVIGNRVSDDLYQSIYGEDNTYGTSEYLKLVDFAIKPHLNTPNWEKSKLERVVEASKRYAGTIYGLSDKSAYVVNGNQTYVVGKDWAKIQNGKFL